MDRTDRHGTVLYHGTENKFKIPDRKYFKSDKDFGEGFYLTTDIEQAEKFARLRMKSANKNKAYVNQYWISSEDLNKLKMITIDNSVDWLRYIMYNRGYNDSDIAISNKFKGYDILCGKVADARISNVLNRYNRGGYNRTARALGITPEEVVIMELNAEIFVNQIVFKTDEALQCLKFRKVKVIQQWQ